MPYETVKGKNTDIRLWAKPHEVESAALDQLRNISSLPWIAHVAVMPDVHLGKGATVGSVIGMRGAVSPAAVGVDIGCGMIFSRTSLTSKDLPESLREVRAKLESLVPVGFNSHPDSTASIHADKLSQATINAVSDLADRFNDLDEKVQDLSGRASQQIGTLGGGNHFIELCLDEEDRVCLMLHSGSRKIGHDLAKVHMARAKEMEHNQGLIDRDLAVFLAQTPEMEAYRRDLYWAQEYARINRYVMLELCQAGLRCFWPEIEFSEEVHCHHNYVNEEVHFDEDLFVTRKGAVSAKQGEMGIIPGSMGVKSFIVRGLGNADSLTSASHGAGRRMSRNKAKKTFTLEDLEKQTEGVECRKDKGVIDEIPEAYKDIDQVMANQSDLVEVVHQIKQILCVKG